jgi:hypothetical protein
VDRKIQIAELTTAYLRTRARQLSTGAAGVNEFVDRTLFPDVQILENPASLPEERSAALDRILAAGLFEESLFKDFPGLRPK